MMTAPRPIFRTRTCLAILLVIGAGLLIALFWLTGGDSPTCIPVTDVDLNNDGAINIDETIEAVRLFEKGLLKKEHVEEVIAAWKEDRPVSVIEFCG